MKAFLVTLKFHWGYSIRSFFVSKATESYTIPPLSSVLGAVVRGIMVSQGSRIENIKSGSLIASTVLAYMDDIKYYAVSLEYKPMRFVTLVRSSTTPYHLLDIDVKNTVAKIAKRETDFKSAVAEFFAPIENGMASYPGGIMRLFLIVNEQKIRKEHLYSISRLGSKESVASVYDVMEVNKCKKVKEGESVTDVRFSFSPDYANVEVGNFYVEVVPELLREYFMYNLPSTSVNIKSVKVFVPLPSVKARTVRDTCVYETPYGNIIGDCVGECTT